MEYVSQWKAKFRNTNVFRSYSLYSSDTKDEETIGPFLLDIDRTIEQNGGYLPDFDRALKDTRLLAKEYCSSLKDEDYRIFFTGHKGFHIEIHPRAISIPPNINRRQYFEDKRKEINKRFGAAFVDKFHDHVRLHDSINSWIDYHGQRINSMNFEVTIDQLFNLSADDIFTKAKNLAHEVLKL